MLAINSNFIVFCVVFLCVTVSAQNPIVSTTIGLIRGYQASDGDYYAFTGIPYAEVDRSNPFGNTNPQPPFEGIFDANEDTYLCPQEEEFNNTLVGDLDCLRMNIFVPTTASASNPLPVLFWIFGGRFTIGFNREIMYGPKYLVRNDIILVTINYRLGPYGFFCLDIPEVPGNQGLKDQLTALRFVQDNIGAFGGDPTQVTIAGHSAGAMSVDFQLLHHSLYPNSPKTFDKAIIQSGTSYSPSYFRPPADTPFVLAEYLGFTSTNLTEVLTFLAALEPLTLIEAANTLNLYFAPCVEKSFEGVESFITEDWVSLTDMESVRNMSIMMGFSNHESYFNRWLQTLEQRLAITFDATSSDFEGMAEIAQQFFFGDEEDSEENYEPLTFSASDLSFIYPVFRSMQRFLKNGVGKVYLYQFSYVGERNFIQQRLNVTGRGAWHGDELGYLFEMAHIGEPNERDQVMVDRMSGMWVNFVKYGDPTPDTTELLPVKWESIVNDSKSNYMNIDWEMTAGDSIIHERVTFWDLFFEANSHLENFVIENSDRN